MKLSELARAAQLVIEDPGTDPEVLGLTEDSRRLSEGDLFVALSGSREDGARYVSQALERGAVAVAARQRPSSLPDSVPFLCLTDDRKSLSKLSSALFGEPAAQLRLTAVTGTKGKTTCVALIRGIANAADNPIAGIGTNGVDIGERHFDTLLTTPSATELHQIFAEVVDASLTGVAMEVSSHAIEQQRVEGLCFEEAVFTNLAADHLDYHATIEDYFQTKRRLFVGSAPARQQILNIDDSHGRRLHQDCKLALTFGTDSRADVRLLGIQESVRGLTIELETPNGRLAVNSTLIGRYNAWNIGAAVAWGISRGYQLAQIKSGVEAVSGVAGRMERLDCGQPYLALVDFAHNGPALSVALEALKKITHGRLLVVFGCGGDRDPERRRFMAEAAMSWADTVIITSDNPRHEDAAQIVEEIRSHALKFDSSVELLVEVDRRLAIDRATHLAEPADTLLIAGRGHETHQLVGDERLEFDDRVVLEQALSARGYHS